MWYYFEGVRDREREKWSLIMTGKSCKDNTNNTKTRDLEVFYCIYESKCYFEPYNNTI